MQTGKVEIKLSLFVDAMILYKKILKTPPEMCLKNYIGMNLTKEVKNLYKTLRKEIEKRY
jgi:hypothetical protein